MQPEINNYSIVFYKEENIVGISNVDSTYSQAKNLAEALADSSGEYLPNMGDYDRVGFIKSYSMEYITAKATEDLAAKEREYQNEQ